ncbi:MAG: AhpC/TSA family protein [Actinomycetota bacterium]
MHCREHAAQLRERHDEIRELGAEIVTIGTGNPQYAEAFVRDEQIPYLVLVDDDEAAARVAGVRSSSFIGLFNPRTWKTTRETMRRGHRIHRAGKRVTQLGATFVVGPGDVVHYSHVDADSTDHAPLDDVIEALRAAASE